MADVGEGETRLCAQTLLTLQLLTLVGYFTGLLLTLHDVEGVAGGRSAVESQDDSGLGGSGLLHALVTFVEHSLDASVSGTCQHHVTHFERAV